MYDLILTGTGRCTCVVQLRVVFGVRNGNNVTVYYGGKLCLRYHDNEPNTIS